MSTWIRLTGAFMASIPFAFARADQGACDEQWLTGPLSSGLSSVSVVAALAAWDEDGAGPGQSALLVGGIFERAGGVMVSNFARWDRDGWSGFGGGANSSVLAIAIYRDELVIGGAFSSVGDVSASRIARWDGQRWQPMGRGVYSLQSHYVAALLPYKDELIVGGRFTTAGDAISLAVARWNGATWNEMQSGVSAPHGLQPDVRSLAAFAGGVVVGGSFTRAQYLTVGSIALWNGQNWEAVGAGISGGVISAMTVASDELIVGGSFSFAGGVPARKIARVRADGVWLPMADGLEGSVRALSTHDDVLVAAYSMTGADGASVGRVARWTGSQWQTLLPDLASETSTGAYVMLTFDSRLVVGGYFAEAGGRPATSLVEWGTPGVLGDADGSGAVDLSDVDCFVSALVSEADWSACGSAGPPQAYTCVNDANRDGAIDFDDIDAFITCLLAGCGE